jgi:hypothetical protein
MTTPALPSIAAGGVLWRGTVTTEAWRAVSAAASGTAKCFCGPWIRMLFS